MKEIFTTYNDEASEFIEKGRDWLKSLRFWQLLCVLLVYVCDLVKLPLAFVFCVVVCSIRIKPNSLEDFLCDVLIPVCVIGLMTLTPSGYLGVFILLNEATSLKD